MTDQRRADSSRIPPLESREEVAKRVKLVLEVILGQLVSVDESFDVSYELGEKTILFHITSSKLGSIIGRKGKTIECLRHLAEAVGSKNGFRVVIQTVF